MSTAAVIYEGVRRHFDAIRLRQHADFLQFENAARMADIRLNVVHQVPRAEL